MYRIHKVNHKATKYENVYECELRSTIRRKELIEKYEGATKFFGRVTINGYRYDSKAFDTLREAALWVDKKRIEHKLEPRNILKAVNK